MLLVYQKGKIGRESHFIPGMLLADLWHKGRQRWQSKQHILIITDTSGIAISEWRSYQGDRGPRDK